MTGSETPYYACAAAVGREFEVAEELAEVAPWVWVARMLKPVRAGKSRKREWSTVPMFPGYVFAQMDGQAFFEARNIKGLHKTKLQLHPTEARALIRDVHRIDDAYEAEKRRLERQEAPPVDFTPGQRVEVLDRALMGRLVAFECIIRRGDQQFAKISIDGTTSPFDVPIEDLRAAE